MLIYQVAKNAGYELDMANADREKLMARAILGAVDSRFMAGLMKETIKEMPKEKYPKRKVLVKERGTRTRARGGNDAEEPVMLKGVHDGHLNRSKPKSFDRLEFLW